MHRTEALGTIALVHRLAEALQHTRDYVQPKVDLPEAEGWSWYDALRSYERWKADPAAALDVLAPDGRRHRLAAAALPDPCVLLLRADGLDGVESQVIAVGLQRLVESLPGAVAGIMLTDGQSLDVLSDDDLARVGLARVS